MGSNDIVVLQPNEPQLIHVPDIFDDNDEDDGNLVNLEDPNDAQLHLQELEDEMQRVLRQLVSSSNDSNISPSAMEHIVHRQLEARLNQRVQILEEKLQEDEEGIIRLMQEQQLRLQAMQQQQDEDALAAALAQSLSSNNNAPPNQLPNQTEIDTLRAEFEQQIEERRQALTEQRALRERLRSQIDALRLRQQQNAANDDEEEDNDANSIRRLFGMMSAPRGGYSGRGRGSHYAQMYDAHSLSSFGSNAQSIANLWREQPAQRLHRDRRNPYDRHHGYGRGRGRGGMFRGNWDDLQAQRHRHRRRRGAANQNAEKKKKKKKKYSVLLPMF